MATKRRSFTAIILSVLLFISSFALIFGNLQTKKAKASEQIDHSDYLYYFSDNTSPLITQSDIDSEYYNYLIRMYSNAFTFEAVVTACYLNCEDLFVTPSVSDNTITQITEGELHDFDEVDFVSNTAIVFEMSILMPMDTNVDFYVQLFENLRSMGFKVYLIASFEAADLEQGDSLINSADGFYQYYPEQYFFDFAVSDMINNQDGVEGATFIFDSTMTGNASFATVYRTSSHLRCLFSLIRDELADENKLPLDLVFDHNLEIYANSLDAQKKLFNIVLGSEDNDTESGDYSSFDGKKIYALGYWYLPTKLYNTLLAMGEMVLEIYLIQNDPIVYDENGLSFLNYNRIAENEPFYRATTKDLVVGQIEDLYI